ncbi:hypothetical protein FHS51_002223 [Sphingobium wenxiniae]|uniref:DUF2889 family protein n=1 Tax=Sphingobium wenxiniae (strain DSM 21828 / CGMCC 1.7748 / JZ-1) TaxID=595605 RepID=A0A562KMI7_SPHWJ|nr:MULTISPECIES: DUF2889 domain-containing protein [Sphingobium]MBB6191991.1 hypothetical protein [Sphingobium wenxiniae]TWH96584.1 Protein of unknown function (DUF2889) [Sphingobium wenxiniae]WRD75448.1 DUF2889 domain-containing protein [Sphingobium baderi]
MNDTDLPIVNGPAPPTPPRARFSIRRTSTIDTTWPDGREAPMVQHGRARDLMTLADVDAPLILGEDRFTARLSSAREILAISSDAARPGIERLVGARAGGQLRAAIIEALPEERAAGTPLYLLLDDIAGSSLVAGWAWSHWLPDWEEAFMKEPGARERRMRMAGVCLGFRPGSSALSEGDSRPQQNSMPVEPLDDGRDAFSWHVLAAQEGPASRRARRIDVRLGERIVIDVHFQDSASTPSGPRMAVHEYLITATADRNSQTLLSIEADPRILPFDECPGAILNLGRLVGTSLSTLRQTVLTELARTEGCTHLNDMVRSLAEVPQLAAALANAMGEEAGGPSRTLSTLDGDSL